MIDDMAVYIANLGKYNEGTILTLKPTLLTCRNTGNF